MKSESRQGEVEAARGSGAVARPRLGPGTGVGEEKEVVVVVEEQFNLWSDTLVAPVGGLAACRCRAVTAASSRPPTEIEPRALPAYRRHSTLGLGGRCSQALVGMSGVAR
jgi:hypothetical protein